SEIDGCSGKVRAESSCGQRADWRRDAWVTRTTNVTMLVSAQSLPWLKDRVVLNPLIDDAESIRTFNLELNLDVAIQHPDLNGLREGPWS
ncbi:hypothetical protein, partial [Nocardioides sp.]|uniref:hypothetical protein n=1 Tax=Nocardioides sp. TaxID=35761 RepID=UPI00286A4F6D